VKNDSIKGAILNYSASDIQTSYKWFHFITVWSYPMPRLTFKHTRSYEVRLKVYSGLLTIFNYLRKFVPCARHV